MNKILDLFLRIVSFILCGILFFILIIYLGLNTFTRVVNTENVIKIVVSLDIKDVMGEDFIYSLYEDFDENKVDRNIIEGIINDKDFKTLIGKILGNTIEVVLYDKDEPVITVNEIIYVVDKHIDKISGVNLTSDERSKILEDVKVEAQEMINSLSIEESLREELTEEDILLIRFIFGKTLQTFLLILSLLIIGIIALCRWSIYRFAIWTGVTTTVVGGSFIILCYGLSNLLLIQNYIDIAPSILEVLNKYVLSTILNTGMMTLVIGIIQIIYYYVMKKREANIKICY